MGKAISKIEDKALEKFLPPGVTLTKEQKKALRKGEIPEGVDLPEGMKGIKNLNDIPQDYADVSKYQDDGTEQEGGAYRKKKDKTKSRERTKRRRRRKESEDDDEEEDRAISQLNEDEYGKRSKTSKNIKKGWKKYLDAWNDEDLETVMECFTDRCVLSVYDTARGEGTFSKGKTEVAAYIKKIFEDANEVYYLTKSVHAKKTEGHVFALMKDWPRIELVAENIFFGPDGLIKKIVAVGWPCHPTEVTIGAYTHHLEGESEEVEIEDEVIEYEDDKDSKAKKGDDGKKGRKKVDDEEKSEEDQKEGADEKDGDDESDGYESVKSDASETEQRQFKQKKVKAEKVDVPNFAEQCWEKLSGFLEEQNIEGILDLYCEDALITTFDSKVNQLAVFEAEKGIARYYGKLFDYLTNKSDYARPFVHIRESPHCISVVWRSPRSGIVDSTDTYYVEATDGKIRYHNAVIQRCYAVKTVWEEQYAALQKRGEEKNIMEHYSEDSELTLYNSLTGEEKVYKGLKKIKKFWKFLFNFRACAEEWGVALKYIEWNENPHGNIFYVWRNIKGGLDLVSNTVLVPDSGKITKHFVVIWPKKRPGQEDEQGSANHVMDTEGSVYAAYEKHQKAFEKMDKKKFSAGYSENAVIRVYDKQQKQKLTYKGQDAAKDFFSETLSGLKISSDLAKLIVHVDETHQAANVVWKYPGGRDTSESMIFDDEGNILYHNVAFCATFPDA